MQFRLARLFLVVFVAALCSYYLANYVFGPDRAKRTYVMNYVESHVKYNCYNKELEYEKLKYNKLEYIRTYTHDLYPRYESLVDIRLVAVVPRDQIEQWLLPERLEDDVGKPTWHKETAKEIDVELVNEWYTDGFRTVGLDRTNSIIVWRNSGPDSGGG